MKIRSSLVLVAASSLILAGCSSTSGGSLEGCVTFPDGKEIKAAKISEDVGNAPSISIPKGTNVTESQSLVVVDGKGAQVKPGDTVSATISLFNATTGESAFTPAYDGTGTDTFPADKAAVAAALVGAVNCHPVGSRVAVLATPADLFAESGQPALNIAPTDSVLLVADIVSSTAPSPTPSAPAAPSDRPMNGAFSAMPTVKFDDAGTPTLSLPETEAPEQFELEVLSEGDGAVVGDASSVDVFYQGTIWQNGVEFDGNFGSGTPATFNVTQVVPGFTKALVGQKVGSRVVAVLPPTEGYGTQGNARAGIRGTDTLVFVVEIVSAEG